MKPRNRCLETLVRLVVWAAILQSGLSSQAQSATTYHEQADQALQSFLLKFWDGSAQYLQNSYPSDSTLTGYWTYAHGWEALMDGVERTGHEQYSGLIESFYEGQNANGWTNGFYDDECWMTVALTRAYDLTGSPQYLTQATNLYADIMTGWDTTCCGATPGGLWWDKAHTQKATAANAGAALAGARLYQRTGNAAYLSFAQQVYSYWYANMVDPTTFQVCDHLNPDGSKTWWRFTYNEGLMIGASVELNEATGNLAFLTNADNIAGFMVSNEVTATAYGPVLYDGTDTGCGGDCHEFKGPAYRYLMRLYAKDTTKTQYYTVLKASADALWNLALNSTSTVFSVNWAGPSQSAVDQAQDNAACIALNRFAEQYGPYPGSGIPANQYEAENATLHNLGLEALYGAFTGWGYIADWNADGQSVDFNITCTTAGHHTLVFRYAAGTGNASRLITVNGANTFRNQTFPGTGAWETYATNTLSCNLLAGTNTISVIYKSSRGSINYLNLDNLVVGGDSSTALGSSANPSTYGNSVTFTATVTSSGGIPTGAVTFYDGATSLGAGALGSGTGNTATATLVLAKPTATTHSITAVYGGDNNFNASTSSALSQVVNARTLTVGLTGTTSKTYDGTRAATLAAGNYTLPGVVSGDTVNLNNPTSGTYDTKDQGAGETVSVTGLAISGASAGNYTLSSTSASAAIGTIAAKALTVSGLTASAKVYDGTTTEPLGGTAAFPTAEAAGAGTTSDGIPYNVDSVSAGGTAAGAFATKDVGTAKAVTVTGVTVTGTGNGNYTVTQQTGLTANITQKALTVTGIGASNKIYDGNTTAALTGTPGTLSGVVSGDTVTLGGTATGAFGDKNVGTGKTVTISGLGLAGGDAGNYSLTAPTATADITGAGTTTALVSSENPSGPGSNVTFTATVSSGAGTPAGNVVFLANGVPFSTNTLVSGAAAASTTALPLGTNGVAAQYATQGNYLASSNSLDQVMKGLATCSQTSAILRIADNLDGTFTITFIGTPQMQYYVVASPDVTAPMDSWAPLAGSTNTVTNTSGQWQVTVTNTAPQQYYRSTAVVPCP